MGYIYEYKESVRTETVLTGFKCNCCHKTFTDNMDVQEVVRFSDIGGYNCAFGDDVEYDITLCTKCAYKLLKDYVEYPGGDC